MIVFIFILLTIYLLYYVTYSKNEYYTSFNVDAIQEKLDKMSIIRNTNKNKDHFNKYIDNIYDNYFENNYNEEDHYNDGSFPSNAGFRLDKSISKKNYMCYH